MKIFSMREKWIRVPLKELHLMSNKTMIMRNHFNFQLEEEVMLMMRVAFRIRLKAEDQKRNTQMIYHSLISV